MGVFSVALFLTKIQIRKEPANPRRIPEITSIAMATQIAKPYRKTIKRQSKTMVSFPILSPFSVKSAYAKIKGV